MSVISTITSGAEFISQNLTITNATEGFVALPAQAATTPAPVAGMTKVYADSAGNLSWTLPNGAGPVLDTSGLTAARMYALPDADGQFMTAGAAQTLQNKTILSSAGNVVDATSIRGTAISSSPAPTGSLLQYDGSQWAGAQLSASAPATLAGNTIGVAVGTSAGTVAAGNDARFSAPQVLRVKQSGAGAGEFTSIRAALLSINDSGPLKPYRVEVGAGVFTEGAMELQPYTTLIGAGSSTIVVPASDSINLFTLHAYSFVDSISTRGIGGVSSVGFLVDSAELCYMIQVNVAGFATCVRVRGTTGPCKLLMSNCRIGDLYSIGVHVDGRALSSSYACRVSLASTAFLPGQSADSLRVEGPYAVVTAAAVGIEGTGVGRGLYLDDGATFLSSGMYIIRMYTGVYVSNSGAGPVLRMICSGILDSASLDASIMHPAATGIMAGCYNSTKVSVINGSSVVLYFGDSETPGLVMQGDMNYAPSTQVPMTDIGPLIEYTTSMGIYYGGTVSDAGGLAVTVTGGEGYIAQDTYPNHYILNLTWTDQNVSLAANSTAYVYVDLLGLHTAGSPPDTKTAILLARVHTGAAGVEFIGNQRANALHPFNDFITFQRNVIGAVFVSGGIVSANTSRQLAISSGSYYYLNNQLVFAGQASPAQWYAYYHAGASWTRVAQTVVDNAQYDYGSALGAIPAGKYVKHILYMAANGSQEYYFLVYGQTVYDTLDAAAVGTGVTTPPPWFSDSIAPIAGIIVQEGTTTIVDVLDMRPRLGTSASGASATVIRHGDLFGLLNDDHPQYLRADGSRVMTGGLNMGWYDITSVGAVNGVAVEAHTNRHLPNGADPLTTAAPVTALGGATVNATGTANSLARSDHMHAIDQSTFTLDNLGGTLSVAKGGTGVTTLGAGYLLTGAGTGPISATKVAPAGDVVGTSDTQTLAAKSLVDTSTRIVKAADNTAYLAVSLSGASAGAALTLSAAPTGARTLTLPDATDTVVGRATADTLLNKTMTDNSTYFADSVAPTKRVQIICGGAAVGTLTTLTSASTADRTLTLPNATDTIVARGTADTLTNKTITSATNVVYASGLQTTGAAVIIGSAGPPAAGQVLKATSATFASWGAAGDVVGPASATSDNAVLFDGTTGKLVKNSAVKMLTPNSTSIGIGRGTVFGSVTTGDYNTALGGAALAAMVTGTHNCAVGYGAMGNHTGSYNAAIGDSAGSSGSGTYNVAIGDSAMAAATTFTGSYNMAIGGQALYSLNTTSARNTAIGYKALFALGSACSNNNAVGFQAGVALASGSNNVLLGDSAASAATALTNVIAIGNSAGSAMTNTSNCIVIGNPGSSTTAGEIRIGTSGTHTTAYVSGIRGVTTAAADAIPVVVSSTGQLGTVSSSGRFKEDVEDLAGSEVIYGMRPVSFRYVTHCPGGKKSIGLIAEEVAEIYPDMVVHQLNEETGEPEILTLDYSRLPVLLLAEMQKLRARVAELERECSLGK